MDYCWKDGKNSDVDLCATQLAGKKFWACSGCNLAAPRIVGRVEFRYSELDTRQEALDHLLEHREQGDKVPERALKKLRQEIATEARPRWPWRRPRSPRG